MRIGCFAARWTPPATTEAGEPLRLASRLRQERGTPHGAVDGKPLGPRLSITSALEAVGIGDDESIGRNCEFGRGRQSQLIEFILGNPERAAAVDRVTLRVDAAAVLPRNPPGRAQMTAFDVAERPRFPRHIGDEVPELDGGGERVAVQVLLQVVNRLGT